MHCRLRWLSRGITHAQLPPRRIMRLRIIL